MNTVEQLREILTSIAIRYGVEKMSVFGSVARGDATEHSDVDLLVDMPKNTGLFAFGGLYVDIENALDILFDLLSGGITDKAFLASIRKEEIPIYVR